MTVCGTFFASGWGWSATQGVSKARKGSQGERARERRTRRREGEGSRALTRGASLRNLEIKPTKKVEGCNSVQPGRSYLGSAVSLMSSTTIEADSQRQLYAGKTATNVELVRMRW